MVHVVVMYLAANVAKLNKQVELVRPRNYDQWNFIDTGHLAYTILILLYKQQNAILRLHEICFSLLIFHNNHEHNYANSLLIYS